MDPRSPRPLCPETNPVHSDPGTLIPGRSPTPGSTGRFAGAGAEQLWLRILNTCYAQQTQDKIGALATSLHSLETLAAESGAHQKGDHLKKPGALRKPDDYAAYAEHSQTRGQVIDSIGTFRMSVNKLSPEELHISGQEFKDLQDLLGRKFRQFSPYYTQMANFNLLSGEGHEAWQRTCNLTSLGMSLEGLALRPESLSSEQSSPDPKLLDKIAALRGLSSYKAAGRMPDFLQILAVALVFERNNSKTTPERAFHDGIRIARKTAASRILEDKFLIELATQFGVKAVSGTIGTVGAERAILKDAKHGIAKMWEKKDPQLHSSPFQRAMAAGAAGGGRFDIDASLAQHREELAKLETSKNYRQLENEEIKENKEISRMERDRLNEIKQYREEILSKVKPSLDNMAQVIVNKPGHFMKLNSIVTDGIVIDDPWVEGQRDHISWDKAWEKGYFRRFIILTK